LGRACDVLAAADYQVIADLLIQEHADYNICFASNEMAIAYTSKSKLPMRLTPVIGQKSSCARMWR